MPPLVQAVDWPTILWPAVLGGGAALSFGWWWLRGKARRGKVQEQFEAFKARVVRSGDVMDQLREQHRKLPVVDADFTVPMEGDTRSEYEAIEDVLDQYRDQWLELMDVWDGVKELFEAGGNKAKFEEASEKLKDSGRLDKLAALESECRQRLARLGNAHETANDAIAKVDAMTQDLIAQLTTIEEHSFDAEPYQTEMDSVAELTDDGKERITPDPLAATRTLGDAREQLQALLQRMREVVDLEKQATELDQRVDAEKQRIVKLQTEGLLFAEPEVSTQSIAKECEELRGEVRFHLNRCALDTARRALESMQRRADSLTTVIDTAVEMRSKSRMMLEERRTALTRLLDSANAAQTEEKYLIGNYPQDVWRRVLENLAEARDMIGTLSELLDQAEAAIDPNTQHYIRASRLIDEVASREPDIARTIALVAERRVELDTQRDQCQRRISNIESEADRIGSLLQQSRADRDLCNNRYRMARERIDTILSATRSQPTDWPEVASRVEQTGLDLERVESLFQQDLELYQQAQSEIRKAERTVRGARSFYRAGVSADVSIASDILLDAEKALANQDYERAVRHANQAEEAARDAESHARQQMERRHREQDRVRWQRRQSQMSDLLEFGATAAARAIREISRRR